MPDLHAANAYVRARLHAGRASSLLDMLNLAGRQEQMMPVTHVDAYTRQAAAEAATATAWATIAEAEWLAVDVATDAATALLHEEVLSPIVGPENLAYDPTVTQPGDTAVPPGTER